jgi:hypothetical protein
MNNDKDLLDVIFKKLEPYGYLNEEIKTHEQVDKILDVLFEEKDITIEDIEIDLINFLNE